MLKPQSTPTFMSGEPTIGALACLGTRSTAIFAWSEASRARPIGWRPGHPGEIPGLWDAWDACHGAG